MVDTNIIAKIKNVHVFKVGNSFAIRIPKALIDTEVVNPKQGYTVQVIKTQEPINIKGNLNNKSHMGPELCLEHYNSNLLNHVGVVQ